MEKSLEVGEDGLQVLCKRREQALGQAGGLRARPIQPLTFITHVKKNVLIYGLIYGLCGGLLIAALKVIEYRFVVVEHSIEIYGGLTALVFAALGIWLGLKLTRKEQVI